MTCGLLPIIRAEIIGDDVVVADEPGRASADAEGAVKLAAAQENVVEEVFATLPPGCIWMANMPLPTMVLLMDVAGAGGGVGLVLAVDGDAVLGVVVNDVVVEIAVDDPSMSMPERPLA